VLVITRAPLRVSFAGGGTDMEDFYRQDYGSVLSTTINKYVYITVKRHGRLFKENYRLNYAETELAQDLDSIKNKIARECLRHVPVDLPVYISTVGDVPSASGLGSSSSFAVALLKGLHAMRGQRVSPAQLVDESTYVEIDILRHPIGKQDQAAAAYGGLNCFRFYADGSVTIEPHSPVHVDRLFKHTLIFWTGITRDATVVLSEQKRNVASMMPYLKTMRDLAEELSRQVKNGMDIETFGKILDEGWRLKRKLASTITTDVIDSWYEKAKAAGALGGKLCGAGGGGFLLFVANPDRHEAIRRALSMLEVLDVTYEPNGAQILVSTSE